MPEDSERRAFIRRGDTADESDVVIVCAECGTEQELQPDDSVLGQISSFLDSHASCS